jgi:PDZ domain-containing secreted protein
MLPFTSFIGSQLASITFILAIANVLALKAVTESKIFAGTGLLKRDGYNGEAEWVVGNEMSKV